MSTVSSSTGSTAATTAGTTSSGSTTSSVSKLGTQYATGTGITSSDGINWSALVNVAVNARKAPATNLTSKISANANKISAYSTMQNLLQGISSAAFGLSGPSGYSLQSKNVFAARVATVTSSGTTSTGAVSVTVSSGTAPAKFELQVSQLAKAEKTASSVQTSSTTALGVSGVFSVQLADGTAQDVTVTNSMTLNDIANAINSTTNKSKVQASVVQVSSGKYRLVVSGSATGQEMTIKSVSGDDVMTNLGVTSSDGTFANELQKQQSASFTYDGVQSTRSTNTITDLISGVTLDLNQTTGSDTLSVTLGSDTTTIMSAITDLVSAYNSYRSWALSQQAQSTDGTADSNAVLFGDSTLRNISSQLFQALGTSINGKGMTLLGLSFDNKNNLQVNDTTLSNALTNKLSDVQSVLSFGMKASSDDLQLLSHNNNGSDTFKIDLVSDGKGGLTSASINGDTSFFSVSGNTIIGKKGTKYDGLSMVYSGTTSKTITVTTTNGIAEGLYSAAKTASDTTSGSLQSVISNLTTNNTKMQSEADQIVSSAQAYGVTLTRRYSKYESSIQASKSTVTYLTTLLNAKSSS